MSTGDQRRFAPACERNQGPILAALHSHFLQANQVLEIGCGTGQHGAFFAAALPHLSWLPSDLGSAESSVNAWREWSNTANLLPFVELDLLRPETQHRLPMVELIFAANLLHISPPETATALAQLAARQLQPGGKLVVYGPFRYADQPLEPSNQRFVEWLTNLDPRFDIRDKSEIDQLLAHHEIEVLEDIEMPSNNRLLIWQKAED